MRVALTGGIACGKSLLTRYLNELGVETLDADDVVHELVPEDERKRLAKIVFRDAEARRNLEARLHPLVLKRLDAFQKEKENGRFPPIVVIPLLFETHWDEKYDIICAVVTKRSTQIERMTTTRGYTREEAEARLAAQMPVEDKAAQSHYVIENNGSAAELKAQAERFVTWLGERQKEEAEKQPSMEKTDGQ